MNLCRLSFRRKYYNFFDCFVHILRKTCIVVSEKSFLPHTDLSILSVKFNQLCFAVVFCKEIRSFSILGGFKKILLYHSKLIFGVLRCFGGISRVFKNGEFPSCGIFGLPLDDFG